MTYLKIADAGKIASGNVAKVTDKLDGFCQEGQSLNRRPPSKATMNRLIDFRTLNYISISTETLHFIVKNCNCGLEFSGDMSAIMKHELFVSAFTIFWSTLSDPDDRDIDGDRKAAYFSSVFENPPIPVAGKDAITMAGVVKELFVLRRFVSADTTVANFSASLDEKICPLRNVPGDQGGENFGGHHCMQGKECTEVGGLFRKLFVTPVEGEVVGKRKANPTSCTAHDNYNADKATQIPSGKDQPPVLDRYATVVKWIRVGSNQSSISPLLNFMMQKPDAENPFAVGSPGARIIEERREMISNLTSPAQRKVAVRQIKCRPQEPVATRFGSKNTSAAYVGDLTEAAILDSITIIHGGKSTFEQCKTAIERKKNIPKVKKVISILDDPALKILRLILAKKVDIVISPIERYSQLGSHAAGCLVYGPNGIIAQVIRRWEKSVLLLKFNGFPKNDDTEVDVPSSADSRINMGQVFVPAGVSGIAIPRPGVWAAVLNAVPASFGTCGKIKVAKVISLFVRDSSKELKRRFNRHMYGIVPRLIAVSLEFYFTLRSKQTSLPECTFPKFPRGTCWANVESLNDLEVPLCIAPRIPLEPPPDLPTFPTQGQVSEARSVVEEWDALPTEEQFKFPQGICDLMRKGSDLRNAFEVFCLGEINPLTGFPFSLRHFADLHQHFYAHVSPLMQITSINREWAFSVLKCFILRGNYRASLLRFLNALIVASGSHAIVTQMGRTEMKEARALRHKLANWYGSGQGLLEPRYDVKMKNMTFETLAPAYVGEAAVPRIAAALLGDHSGSFSALGVKKQASLIVHFGGDVHGRVVQARQIELESQWNSMDVSIEKLREEAKKHEFDSAASALQAKDDGVLVSMEDDSAQGALKKLPVPQPSDLVGNAIEMVFKGIISEGGKEELFWLYGEVMEVSDGSVTLAGGSKIKKGCVLVAWDTRLYAKDDPDAVSWVPVLDENYGCSTQDGWMQVEKRSAIELSSDGENGEVEGLVDELFVEEEEALGKACDEALPEVSTRGDPALVEVPDGSEEADCFSLTAKALPLSTRGGMMFLREVELTLDGGIGARVAIQRRRDLDVDQVLLYDEDDGPVLRVRVDDVLRERVNEDGVPGEVYILGSPMYSITELDKRISSKLRANVDFDDAHELVESTNPELWSLEEAIGVVTVMSTAAYRIKTGNEVESYFHQGRWFVDNDDRAGWKLSETPKERLVSQEKQKKRKRVVRGSFM